MSGRNKPYGHFKLGGNRRGKTAGGSGAGSCTDVESGAVYAPFHSIKNEQFTAPVSLRIRSYRTRLCDADGISAKAIIDGLVNCGILQDDSTEHITSIEYSQEKVKNSTDEKVVIVITQSKE